MRNSAETFCCLMFHGIGVPSHPMEPDEELYWINWPFFEEILQYCASTGNPVCTLTFDDGNSSDLRAARLMHEKGLVGSFFILVGRIGDVGYLTADEILEIQALGMEIGLHGRDHVDWRVTDDATLRREIDEAAEELANLCEKPIRSLAIPYGHYNRRVRNYLQDSVFEKIYTSDKGLTSKDQRFHRRNPIMAAQTLKDIEDLAYGRASLSDRIRRQVMPLVKAVI